MSADTIQGILAQIGQSSPDRLFTRFLKRGEEVASFTYGEAWLEAVNWAFHMRQIGIERGDIVIMPLPSSEEFIGAYFGTLLAGGIPAPAAPIRRFESDDPYLEIIMERLRFAKAQALVVPSGAAAEQSLLDQAGLSEVRLIKADEVEPAAGSIDPAGSADDVGLLQFTSGTSGKAKAVQLTQAALIAQTRLISDGLHLDRETAWAVSWLPLFHDMGLIGFLLTPACLTGHVTIMRTEDYVMRPGLWLKALTEYEAPITGGPPSGYALCVKRVKDSDVSQYNLENLRIALVGAEMIHLEGLNKFAEKFGPAGFKASSYVPTYGMAENGLAVTMPGLDQEPEFDTIDPLRLQEEGIASPAPENGSTRAMVSVGPPLAETQVVIVDETGTPVEERRIGEITVASPSLMKGYLNQPDATHEVLRDGRLFTGDMGYLSNGKLYVTGRKKEVLIVGGRNYYPEDLESVASAVEGIRRGRTVAFSYVNEERATESVVLMAETSLSEQNERERLQQEIRKRLVKAGYPINEVILLRPKTIKSTMSGKVRRLDCKNRFLTGEFSNEFKER